MTERLAERTDAGTPPPSTPRLSGGRVVALALSIITLQLLYRVWCIHGSGWWLDDFRMMNRVLATGSSPSALLRGYDSHMMPGVFYLTSLLTKHAPYDFTPAAALVVVMEAVASLGMLCFLVVAFGRRPGILAPLSLYVVSPFGIQNAVWWTPGSHNFMLQAALSWGMAAQVSYLRTRNWVTGLAAVGCVAIGLLFLEKALLVIGALAIVTVAYFTQGSPRERLAQLWGNYRLSVLANLALGVAYLGLYVHFALAFAPSGATNHPIGPMVDSLVLRSWVSGLFGGPLTWSNPRQDPILAAPASGLVVVCLVCLALVVRELARSRTASLRSLWLPGYFLAADVLLLVAAHQGGYAGAIGFEFRYIGELSAASAMALGLATMPIRGAVEAVRVTHPSPLLDNPRRVTFACTVVVVLSVFSTTQYVESWNTLRHPSAEWLQNFVGDAKRLPTDTALMDTVAPNYVALPTSYPASKISHLMRPVRPDLRFPLLGNESMRVAGPDGRIQFATVGKVRAAPPSSNRVCAHRVDQHGGAVVKLDGPLQFGDWWIRIGYLASRDTSLTVSGGGATYHAHIDRGVHILFFRSGGQPFDRVHIGRLHAPAVLCTDDVAAGQPQPRRAS